MSLATYSDLQTQLGTWLNRSDLTSFIPDFIILCESDFYAELRVAAMEASLSGTIASGVIAVPSDYIELKHARLDGSPTTPLQRKTATWIYENYPIRASNSKPKFIARDAGNFIFGAYPDSNYSVLGTYYKRLTALSASSTNWFMTNYPGLYLYGALCQAEPFLKNDARLPLWQAMYEKVKNQIQHQEDLEQTSGSVMSITAS